MRGQISASCAESDENEGGDEDRSPQTPDPADSLPDTVGGPDSKADILLADVNFDKGHLPSRGEAGEWLKTQGLSKDEQAIVLAVVFDRLCKTVAIAGAVRRNRKTVAKIRRRGLVRDCISHLQSGKPLQLPESQAVPDRPGGMWLTVPLSSAPRHGLELNLLVEGVRECRVGGTLSEEDDSRELKRTLATIESCQRPYFPRLAAEFAMAFAQDLIGANANDPKGAAGFAIIYPDRGKEIAEAIIACIRKHPAVLLQPEGRILLEGLVDLLEAARFGCSNGRVRGLLPSGKSKELVRFAQALLVELTKAEHGAKRSRPEGYLCWILDLMAERVEVLQRECTASKGNSAARVAQMREAHPAELEGLTDKELHGYLTDPPTEVACRLAAKAANTTRDLMKRIQNSTEAKQATDNPILSLAFGLPSVTRRIFQLVAGSAAQ